MACSFTPHDQPVRWNPLRRTYSCRTSTARSALCKSCNSWPSTLLIIPVDIRITTAQTWKLPQTRRSRSKRGGRQNVEPNLARLGIQPFAHYARIIGADRFWVEEDLRTLLQPQVMLAWLMNDQPIPPKHGTPLRLIIPFRYGARHVKAISEVIFTPTGFPLPTLPG